MILAFIRSKLASKEFALIKKAYSFSKKKHSKQKRFSGEPYFNHLISTALILSDYDVDAKTIAAALLHDILEDTNVKKKELEQEFGSEVAELVYALTKVSSENTNKHAYLRKLLNYASKDERVLLIKLADKLHNLRTIEYLPVKKRKEICKQALEFYAPLAEQDAEIDEAIEMLKKKLVRKPFASFIFKKEKKHLYHYFRKIKEGKTLEELYDYIALVIVASSEDACYEALKAVHSMFYPMPRKFKDYIALPLGHYRALHTSVIGPRGAPIKVYIRTRETDEFEEKGIAYWLKAKKKPSELLKLRELAKADESEFEEALRTDYLERELAVFDSFGKPIFMPRGSTVLDFSFKVDSAKAPKTACARVNGKLVPIWHELRPGDRVELVYAKDSQIISDWFNFAKCYETKQAIRSLVEPEEKSIKAKLRIEAENLDAILKSLGSAVKLGFIRKFSVDNSGKIVKASFEIELKNSTIERELIEILSNISGIVSISSA